MLMGSQICNAAGLITYIEDRRGGLEGEDLVGTWEVVGVLSLTILPIVSLFVLCLFSFSIIG